ncbi:MAG: hypothetical protein JXR86_16710 [Spirochaetales bacterium]|nr:hypothetical protein [Spirochaetales bacterium]
MKDRALLFLVLLMFSCSQEHLKEDIAMPSTPMLTASSRWGVVSSSYIRITDQNDRLNNIIATLRKGDIVEVLSRESDKESGTPGYWYEVRSGEIHGVVPEGMIDLYDSREKAENASKRM